MERMARGGRARKRNFSASFGRHGGSRQRSTVRRRCWQRVGPGSRCPGPNRSPGHSRCSPGSNGYADAKSHLGARSNCDSGPGANANPTANRNSRTNAHTNAHTDAPANRCAFADAAYHAGPDANGSAVTVESRSRFFLPCSF